MTPRQRLHFIWLTIMNADRMAKECRTKAEASSMIQKAQDRRARLGLPLHQINDSQKRAQIYGALARTDAYQGDPFQ